MSSFDALSFFLNMDSGVMLISQQTSLPPKGALDNNPPLFLQATRTAQPVQLFFTFLHVSTPIVNNSGVHLNLKYASAAGLASAIPYQTHTQEEQRW